MSVRLRLCELAASALSASAIVGCAASGGSTRGTAPGVTMRAPTADETRCIRVWNNAATKDQDESLAFTTARLDSATRQLLPIAVRVHGSAPGTHGLAVCAFAVSYPSKRPTFFVVRSDRDGRFRVTDSDAATPLHRGKPNATFDRPHSPRLVPGPSQ